MRKAAVTACLIPDNPSGHARLAFVSEGEASLHFSMESGLPSGTLKNGDGVVIVDAGRETIDLSVYRRNTTEGGKETFDEMADTQCHFYGSEVVTVNARKFIGGESRKYVVQPFTDFFPDFLAESPFIKELEHIVQRFDVSTRLRFRNQNEYQYVKFREGPERQRANDATHNIRYGQLKLLGSDFLFHLYNA